MHSWGNRFIFSAYSTVSPCAVDFEFIWILFIGDDFEVYVGAETPVKLQFLLAVEPSFIEG